MGLSLPASPTFCACPPSSGGLSLMYGSLVPMAAVLPALPSPETPGCADDIPPLSVATNTSPVSRRSLGGGSGAEASVGWGSGCVSAGTPSGTEAGGVFSSSVSTPSGTDAAALCCSASRRACSAAISYWLPAAISGSSFSSFSADGVWLSQIIRPAMASPLPSRATPSSTICCGLLDVPEALCTSGTPPSSCGSPTFSNMLSGCPSPTGAKSLFCLVRRKRSNNPIRIPFYFKRRTDSLSSVPVRLKVPVPS